LRPVAGPYLCGFLAVAGSVFCQDWYFQAIEEMTWITVINVVPKLIFTPLIFVFVKAPSDYGLVLLFQSAAVLSSGIAGAVLACHRLCVPLPAPTLRGLLIQLSEGWRTFLATVCTNLYTATNTVILGLMTSGVFDRFPKLKIVIGHGGEGLPYMLYRIDYMYENARYPFMKKVKKLPSDYMKENFYITTSGLPWAPAITMAQSVLGIDRVLYAMDYPYQQSSDEVAVYDAMVRLAQDFDTYEDLIAAGLDAAGREATAFPLSASGFELDPERFEARAAGASMRLTVTEFRLLASLLAAPGFVKSRDALVALGCIVCGDGGVAATTAQPFWQRKRVVLNVTFKFFQLLCAAYNVIEVFLLPEFAFSSQRLVDAMGRN